MARVSRGTTTHARHRKVIKAAKGYYGRRKNTFKVAKQAVDKARQYAYRDRKAKKEVWKKSLSLLKVILKNYLLKIIYLMR